ncbi:NAD(P)/FAD-dependent oxidoreductase [Streptomyces sp. NPDC059752]|uniref:NAD(P)/FAD-dependent oxidoreductase n=1 Tax=unclassified Streptomyces TaxID=2593676 RepID=UPI00364A9E85
MLAAAAVKDHVDSVEILEAHDLPAGTEPRTGVPQAARVHWLQAGGAEAINALLPGTIDLLMAAGAHRIPVTTDMVIFAPEGWYRRWQRATHHVITASRHLTDLVVRTEVLKDPRVTVRTHTKAVGLLGDRRAVRGVRLRDGDGIESDLRADLVIDASGRASRLPRWLAALGIAGLAEEQPRRLPAGDDQHHQRRSGQQRPPAALPFGLRRLAGRYAGPEPGRGPAGAVRTRGDDAGQHAHDAARRSRPRARGRPLGGRRRRGGAGVPVRVEGVRGLALRPRPRVRRGEQHLAGFTARR